MRGGHRLISVRLVGAGEYYEAPTETEVPASPAAGNIMNSAQEVAEEDHFCVMKILTDQLTAPNMFYWMWAVRVMYSVVGLLLQKWGRSYQQSSKKFHLMSYWVQVIVYVPLLAVLTLALVTIQSHDDFLVGVGLFLFAHASLLLLSLYSMEIFLRTMDKTLFLQRLVFLATLLYAIQFEDPGLENPIHQITFGAMEAVGVCSELAAQWNLINYRSWSDGAPHEKERMQHGIAFTLKVCLVCSVVSKLVFFSSSIAWYVLRFDALTGSYLVFVLPLVRTLQAPTLMRSLFVQTQLYNRVATITPPEPIDLKRLERLESEEGTSTAEEVIDTVEKEDV